MKPVTRRWARFAPDNPRMLNHAPRAGVCISAFILARRGRSILLGRVRAHDGWPTKGGYPKWSAAILDKERAWLLPATHLLMEESPDRAARRIVREWVGLKGEPRFLMVQSHLRRGAVWNPKHKENHWDLCFVYELRGTRVPKPKPWWWELRFVPLSEVSRMNLGRGHMDVLEEAGYLR